jgi:hypothetical protein
MIEGEESLKERENKVGRGQKEMKEGRLNERINKRRRTKPV